MSRQHGQKNFNFLNLNFFFCSFHSLIKNQDLFLHYSQNSITLHHLPYSFFSSPFFLALSPITVYVGLLRPTYRVPRDPRLGLSRDPVVGLWMGETRAGLWMGETRVGLSTETHAGLCHSAETRAGLFHRDPCRSLHKDPRVGLSKNFFIFFFFDDYADAKGCLSCNKQCKFDRSILSFNECFLFLFLFWCF